MQYLRSHSMPVAAFSVTAFLDRRPPPSVASPRSSALTAPFVAVRRARSALVAVQTRAPPPSPRPLRLSPPLASSAATIHAPRVFCPPLLDSPGTPLLAKGTRKRA